MGSSYSRVLDERGDRDKYRGEQSVHQFQVVVIGGIVEEK